MSAQGGIKFADGTLQTTAGLTAITQDSTLKGNGTATSPIGVAVPLNLTGSGATTPILTVTDATNGGRVQFGVSGVAPIEGGYGVVASGGAGSIFGGAGIKTTGAQSADTGGAGMYSKGGFGNKFGGNGLEASGGDAQDFAGQGIVALGGTATKGGGFGVSARGGNATGTGNSAGDGIIAIPGTGYEGAARGKAGSFIGDVEVRGVLSKAGGSFKIDHPLDPENKYLSHSFVESPDMMNIYNGNITTDQSGVAVVELPDYFDSLNRDVRYQLTVVGQFAQAIVAEEVKDNRFRIQTSAPNVKVSWQVTGIRQDAWANQNRIKVEEVKSERDRGYYLHPEAFGQTEERGVDFARHPEEMRRMKQLKLGSNDRHDN